MIEKLTETGNTSHKGHKGPPTNLSCHNNISDTLSCYIMFIIGNYMSSSAPTSSLLSFTCKRGHVNCKVSCQNCHRYHCPTTRIPQEVNRIFKRRRLTSLQAAPAGLVIQIDQGLKCTDSQDSCCTTCDAYQMRALPSDGR